MMTCLAILSDIGGSKLRLWSTQYSIKIGMLFSLNHVIET